MDQGIFYGTYPHRVDPQARVAIPARFRELFRGGIVLIQGYDRCVLIYPLDQWRLASQPVAARPMTQARARLLRRMTFATAHEDTLDRQGRVLLPQGLRRYAGIEEEVVFAGVGDALELWNRERWAEQEAKMEEQGAQIAEGIEEWR